MRHTHLESDSECGVVVRIGSDVENGGRGTEEVLRVVPAVDGGSYRVDCIPGFTYGLNFGDVINACQSEGQLRFTRVVQRSGHSTFRIRIDRSRILDSREGGGANPLWVALSEALDKLSCRIEPVGDVLHAIDVPPHPTIDSRALVRDLLEVGVDCGLFDSEEATFAN